jgi:hypothetical protein
MSRFSSRPIVFGMPLAMKDNELPIPLREPADRLSPIAPRYQRLPQTLE